MMTKLGLKVVPEYKIALERLSNTILKDAEKFRTELDMISSLLYDETTLLDAKLLEYSKPLKQLWNGQGIRDNTYNSNYFKSLEDSVESILISIVKLHNIIDNLKI